MDCSICFLITPPPKKKKGLQVDCWYQLIFNNPYHLIIRDFSYFFKCLYLHFFNITEINSLKMSCYWNQNVYHIVYDITGHLISKADKIKPELPKNIPIERNTGPWTNITAMRLRSIISFISSDQLSHAVSKFIGKFRSPKIVSC